MQYWSGSVSTTLNSTLRMAARTRKVSPCRARDVESGELYQNIPCCDGQVTKMSQNPFWVAPMWPPHKKGPAEVDAGVQPDGGEIVGRTHTVTA